MTATYSWPLSFTANAVNLLKGNDRIAMARAMLRASFIAGENTTIFIGDSRAAHFPYSQLCGGRLAKAALGGKGIMDFDHILRMVTILSAPDRYILNIGANDARSSLDFEPRGWSAKLSQILDQMRQTASALYVVSPLPNATSGQYGGAYLNVERIKEMNAAIIDSGVRFIDLRPSMLDGDGRLRQECTNDGMHFNATGYQAMRRAMEAEIAYSASSSNTR